MLFYLRYLAACFLVLLLDGTVFTRLAIAGMRADLSFAMVVIAGFGGNRRGGVALGFLVGLVRGCADPPSFGTEALLLSLVGFAAGTTSPTINRAHPVMQGALIALLLLAHDLVRAFAVSRFAIGEALLLWLRYSPGSALYTALVVAISMLALPRLWPMGERRAYS